jgi:hypothetical protein
MSSSTKRPGRRVLSDHKQVGKKFLPPFVAHLGSINEVSWVDDLLPELLWLGMLNDRHGLREGARLAAALPRTVDAVLEGRHDRWLQLTSQYSGVPVACWERIIEVLDSDVLQTLRETLRPLIALYPNCPLRSLWAGVSPESEASDLQTMRQAVDAILERGSRPATLVQANAIYILFATNKLTVFKGSVLERLEDLVEYPRTQESRLVASGVRAAITGFGSRQDSASEGWTRYFWRHGLELSPCEFQNQERGSE